MKQIFVINGSASKNSENQKIIDNFAKLTISSFGLKIFNGLKVLPHFDPEFSTDNVPKSVLELRKNIETADGILISTPEYVFSIPSGLKNVIEWCVSTSVFSDKPVGIITASTNGERVHEELQLVMRTVMAKLTPDTTLLIQGVKGKINVQGEITDRNTKGNLIKFIEAFKNML